MRWENGLISGRPNGGFAETLQKRAYLARKHALSLYPGLLREEEIDSPSWAEKFTGDDVAYYEEMAINNQNIQRKIMAIIYRDYAWDYIWEALSLFLEWKQEKELSDSGGDGLEISKYAIEQIMSQDFGCWPLLWEQAVMWAANGAGNSQISVHLFRQWWHRAGRAQAHAEWLTQELRMPGAHNAQRPMDPDRLRPPGTVEEYDKTCGIYAVMFRIKPKPFVHEPSTGEGQREGPYPAYEDDAFGTEFSICHTDIQERQRDKYGWAQSSYLYGAPTFVQKDIAENGLQHGLDGLLSLDESCKKQELIPFASYERYKRRGVRDVLPQATSPDELLLASCADAAVVLRSESGRFYWLNRKYRDFPRPRYLYSVLHTVLGRRKHMTLKEATSHNFDDCIYRILARHLDQIHAEVHQPMQAEEIRHLLMVERTLQTILFPWFEFRLLLRGFSADKPIIHLRSLASGEVCTRDPWISQAMNLATSTHRFLESLMAIQIHEALEHVRDKILKKEELSPVELKVLQPFRAYLESGGNPVLMPTVRSGTKPRKELTVVELYDETMPCPPGCGCSTLQIKKKLKSTMVARMANAAQATKNRETIVAFFEHHYGN